MLITTRVRGALWMAISGQKQKMPRRTAWKYWSWRHPFEKHDTVCYITFRSLEKLEGKNPTCWSNLVSIGTFCIVDLKWRCVLLQAYIHTKLCYKFRENTFSAFIRVNATQLVGVCGGGGGVDGGGQRRWPPNDVVHSCLHGNPEGTLSIHVRVRPAG